MLRLGSLRSESETWARLLKRLGPELLGVIDLEDPTASAAPAFWHRFGTHMAWQDLAPMVQLLCDLPEAVAALGGRIRVGFFRGIPVGREGVGPAESSRLLLALREEAAEITIRPRRSWQVVANAELMPLPDLATCCWWLSKAELMDGKLQSAASGLILGQAPCGRQAHA